MYQGVPLTRILTKLDLPEIPKEELHDVLDEILDLIESVSEGFPPSLQGRGLVNHKLVQAPQ